MGFRFNKRIRLAPGVRMNIGKSGASFSIGGRGLTINSRGRATVNIPGTGISHSINLTSQGHPGADLGAATEGQVRRTSMAGSTQIGLGFVFGCIGLFLPIISLIAIPLLIYGYESMIRDCLRKGFVSHSKSTRGLGMLCAGIVLGIFGIFLPVFTFMAVSLIAIAYEGKKKEMGIQTVICFLRGVIGGFPARGELVFFSLSLC